MRTNHPAACIVWVAAAVPALAPTLSFAADYLTAAQAQALMFPQASAFRPVPVQTDTAQAQRLKARLGAVPLTGFMRVSEALAGDRRLGWVVTDSVIGKFELIDYAVALGPAGEILDVEVLSYRESHGNEVRMAAWRKQFVGKTSAAPIAIGDDIANISGATLSCTHLTDGIRRIAAYVQTVLAPAGS